MVLIVDNSDSSPSEFFTFTLKEYIPLSFHTLLTNNTSPDGNGPLNSSELPSPQSI